MIQADTTKILANTTLHIIDISAICPKLSAFIDSYIVQICEGESGSELALTKKNLLNFLKTKSQGTCYGAVAEFFVHLYLNSLGYKQEFLYLNLEEGSIKKGIDGYFSLDTEEFLVESKSGSSSSQDISHKSKISEAYNDLKSVVSGTSKKSKNNPWRNAYNHASHADVNAKASIRKKLKTLSDMYDTGQFQSLANFNIMPCSTIFVEGQWNEEFTKHAKLLDSAYFSKLEAKTVNAICITKSTYKAFVKYLNT